MQKHSSSCSEIAATDCIADNNIFSYIFANGASFALKHTSKGWFLHKKPAFIFKNKNALFREKISSVKKKGHHPKTFL